MAADYASEKSPTSESALTRSWVATNGNGGGVNSLISNQLSLELQIQENCRVLLSSYRESQDWSAVGQLAQTLVTSSGRIGDLKRRLQDQEHLPYLEKIPESGQSQGLPTAALDPLEGSSTTEWESLHKAAVGKQEVLTGDLSGEKNSGFSTGDQDQQNDLACPAEPGEITSEKVSLSKGVESAISSAHLNTSNHINSVKSSEKQTESVEPEAPEIEINDLEDQMEQLANEFTNLSEQYQDDDGEPDQSDIGLATECTELEVPGHPKTTYASSEGSDQFFSPTNSLYNEGESSSGDGERPNQNEEADQFEDARSGSEDVMDSMCNEPNSSMGEEEIPVVFNIKSLPEDLAKSNHNIYSITSNSELLSGVPLLRSYDQFVQLRGQLVPSCDCALLVAELDGTRRDDSAQLEAFLNQAANTPHVREMDCFVRFLQHECGNVSPNYGQ
jgi:hypothetical protein